MVSNYKNLKKNHLKKILQMFGVLIKLLYLLKFKISWRFELLTYVGLHVVLLISFTNYLYLVN